MRKINTNILQVFILLFCATVFVGCSEDSLNEDSNISQTNLTKSKDYMSNSEFLQNVAIFKFHYNQSIDVPDKNNERALLLEVNDFSKSGSLNEYLLIEGVEYSDDGRGYDLVAGDGVYTSIDSFPATEDNENTLNGSEEEITVSRAEEFRYFDEMILELQEYKEKMKPIRPSISVSVGIECEIYTKPCPQTSWYNTCWFTDECTCVYMRNCKVSSEISIELGK